MPPFLFPWRNGLRNVPAKMSFGHNFEDSRWADVTRNDPIGNGIPFTQTYQHSVSDVTGVVLFLVVTYPVSHQLGLEGLHGQEKSQLQLQLQLQREGEGDAGRPSSHRIGTSSKRFLRGLTEHGGGAHPGRRSTLRSRSALRSFADHR